MESFDGFTVEQVIQLRTYIKKLDNPKRTVFSNILYGYYDQHKENAINVAKDDIEFLSK